MKLCGNCDGMVDLEVIICPYCGGDVSEIAEEFIEKEEQGRKQLSLNETLSSLYPPPYEPKVFEEEATYKKEEEEKYEEKEKSFIFPFLIFSLGVNFSLFGLFLIFFSKNGELFLRWNTSFWFLYVILGVGLVFIGNRFLPKD
jgi:hypothetical protein